MTAPCGAQTRDVHGDVICALESDHGGAHSGEVVGGVNLRWSAAPPLSPREREIVDRFEAAPDALDEECGDSHTREWGSITRTYVCDLPAWHRGPHNDFARLYQWGGA